MLKKYDKLWVFGDSYSTPHVCVSPKESFWGLTAIQCDIPTIMNCSRPVNSFDSVCHLLISEQNSYDWDKDLFLIGVPPLERIAIFDDHKNTPYYGHNINTATWEAHGFQIQSHHGIIGLQNYGTDKQLVIHSDRAWLETQVLRNIFLLTTWLDSKNSNYMIVNLSKPFNSNNVWGPSNFVLPYSINHSRCILFNDTYHDINLNINLPADFKEFGWNGHHGSAGNKYFFEQSLLPTMQRNNIC